MTSRGKYCFPPIWRVIIVSLLVVFLPFLRQRSVRGQRDIVVDDHRLVVEIAKTAKEKEQGLSDRKNLCSDCGMLFVFDQEGFYPFWMRRMYFDIDILWIADDRVVDVTLGAKVSSKEEFVAPKTVYQSKFPVNKVLEVNAGWVEKNGIKTGDVVRLDL